MKKAKTFDLKKRIIKLSKQPGGVSILELSRALAVQPEKLAVPLHELIAKGKLLKYKDYFLRTDIPTNHNLSPLGRKLLSDLKQAGNTGIELNQIKNKDFKKQYHIIVRSGLAIAVDDNIIYSTKVYKELVARVLTDLREGDMLSIKQIKTKTGLTRKYALPLINCMENDGFLERIGNERRVLRSAIYCTN